MKLLIEAFQFWGWPLYTLVVIFVGLLVYLAIIWNKP